MILSGDSFKIRFVRCGRYSLTPMFQLLVEGLEFQRSGLYLLYKARQHSGDAGIRSIWFENEGACVRISNLLNRYLVVFIGDSRYTFVC